jgi:hypothetical protein
MVNGGYPMWSHSPAFPPLCKDSILIACCVLLLSFPPAIGQEPGSNSSAMFLNPAPIEFASATGIYLASLFIAFQIVNYLFVRHIPGPGVLLGGAFILAGSAIVYFWK